MKLLVEYCFSTNIPTRFRRICSVALKPRFWIRIGIVVRRVAGASEEAVRRAVETARAGDAGLFRRLGLSRGVMCLPCRPVRALPA